MKLPIVTTRRVDHQAPTPAFISVVRGELGSVTVTYRAHGNTSINHTVKNAADALAFADRVAAWASEAASVMNTLAQWLTEEETMAGLARENYEPKSR